MNVTADSILECLNHTRTRATYKAVGGLLGVPPQSVARYLGIRRAAASWVVNSKSKLPSGYARHQLHEGLLSSPVIKSREELLSLLTNYGKAR